MTTNPNLTSELTIQDPAAVWGEKPIHNSMQTNTAADKSGYVRAITQDGVVVGTETGKVLKSSNDSVVAAITAAQGVPYEAAYDPVYRSRVTPDQVKDDTILRFPNGAEVTARDARNMGWLADASRPLADTQQKEIQLPGKQEEVHPDLQYDLLPDSALDKAYTSLLDNTAGMEQQAAIQQVIANGAIEPKTLGTLATQLQCEPEALEQHVNPIIAAFEQQARKVMAEGGLNSDDVIAFAQQNCPDKLQQAMQRQAMMRQAGGYGEIRQMYLEGLAEYNPSLALNADLGAGITQRQDTKGRVIVRLPDGVEMEWRTAIRAFGPR